MLYCFSSVQFSRSIVSDSLWPHEPQHARPPCPSTAPRVHPNPCPLSQWCHPTISSSVVPFSCCPQSFPASGSFQMSQLFASGGQSIGVAASKSVIPMNMYGCESWTIKKAEHWRIDAFELWCWRRLLRVPWTARRSNQSILKINPGCLLVGLDCLAATLIQAGRSRRFDGLVEIIEDEITWQTKPKPKDKPYNTVVRISEGGHIVAVQSLSHVQLFATSWTAAGQTSLSFTISRSLLKGKSL